MYQDFQRPLAHRHGEAKPAKIHLSDSPYAPQTALAAWSAGDGENPLPPSNKRMIKWVSRTELIVDHQEDLRADLIVNVTTMDCHQPELFSM
jgi:hypothetical protein